MLFIYKEYNDFSNHYDKCIYRNPKSLSLSLSRFTVYVKYPPYVINNDIFTVMKSVNKL